MCPMFEKGRHMFGLGSRRLRWSSRSSCWRSCSSRFRRAVRNGMNTIAIKGRRAAAADAAGEDAAAARALLALPASR